MRLLRTRHFVRNYSKAPQAIQRAFDKQILLLLEDLHHPSLRARKYDESRTQNSHSAGLRSYPPPTN
jgi:hypothetical protein